MASIRVKQNLQRVRDDGMYPLYLQILHRRRKKVIYLGVRVPAPCFDPQAQRVFGGVQLTENAARRANELIDGTVEQLTRRLELLDASPSPYSVEDICDGITVQSKPSPQDLFRFFRRQIKLKEQKKRFASATLYGAVLESLRSYTQGRSCSFERLSARFVSGYAEFLQARGLAAGSISKYFDVFRTVCTRAAIEGLPVQKERIFAGVQVHAGKTCKRAVRKQLLARIARLSLDDDATLAYARDLFLFSFFARGISFVDMLHLTPRNLRDGRLEYYRAKCGTHIAMSVTPQMEHIVRKYAVSGDDTFLFPTLRGLPADAGVRYKAYRSALRNMNRALERIARRAGIETHLTTYVARHSWASCAKDARVPIPVIKEALGHASIKTTEIYLREFDIGVIDRVNAKITKL